MSTCTCEEEGKDILAPSNNLIPELHVHVAQVQSEYDFHIQLRFNT